MPSSVKQKWDQVSSPIASLQTPQQGVFATFSCRRAANYYDAYCQRRACYDQELLSDLIRRAWLRARGSLIEIDELSFKRRLEIISDELEGVGSPDATAAQEACFAGIVLLEILTLGATADQARRIVNFTRDIVDMLVQESADFHGGETLEASILAHPLMQRELQIHEKALQLLSRNDLDNSLLSSLEDLARTGSEP